MAVYFHGLLADNLLMPGEFEPNHPRPNQEQEAIELQAESPTALLEKAKHPTFLLTRAEIDRALEAWTPHEGLTNWILVEEREDLLNTPDPNQRLRKLRTAFKSENYLNIGHEFLNRDYVEGLAVYLDQRIGDLRHDDGSPVRILEVGAGSGRLTHFLKESLRQSNPEANFAMVATDSDPNPWFEVEALGYEEALSRYQPDIVICSWMPMGQEWSAGIRSEPSVREYILIGDTYATGKELETWGLPGPSDSDETFPYQADDFEKIELDNLTALQTGMDGIFSETASFRRLNRPSNFGGRGGI